MRIFPNVGARVETGPIQFGEDWPGIFIRGDNAMGWISMLSAIQTDDPWAKSAIKGLTELLQSCDARTLDATAAPVCTCPSGDGSLRWPCTTHTPTAAPVVVGEEARDAARFREVMRNQWLRHSRYGDQVMGWREKYLAEIDKGMTAALAGD